MRKLRSSTAPLTIGLIAIATALASCGDSGGGDVESTPAVASIPGLTNARYQLLLLDAITGARITDPLRVSFTGEAALLDAAGARLNGTTITTSDGLVTVGATFTATANEFSVQVADNGNRGWVATGQRVTGASGLSGDQLIEVKLVNTSRAAATNASPTPIAMSVQTTTAAADGSFTAPVALATPSKTVVNAEGTNETIGTSRLTIPAGTRGTTTDGGAAAPGALTVSNTYYSNADSSSMAAFPGGFAATVSVPTQNAAVLNGAAPDQGAFITGGFAQFNVTDSSGRAIKNFSPAITVGIDLPKGSLDQDGNVVVVGSQYPVWSYNDATGQWTFERQGTVAEKTPVDPNNFTVQFSTTHLSSWNLDFYGRTCTAQINLTGRPSGDARPLTVDVVGTRGQRFTFLRNGVTDSGITLFRTPMSTATVKILDRGVVVGRVSNRALCGGPITVPLTLAPIPVGAVQVETSESCSDGSSKRPLPTFAWVFKDVWTSGYTQAVTGSNVASKTFSSLSPGNGTVYAFNARTNRYETRQVAITGNTTTTTSFNFTMPCVTGSGGGSTN